MNSSCHAAPVDVRPSVGPLQHPGICKYVAVNNVDGGDGVRIVRRVDVAVARTELLLGVVSVRGVNVRRVERTALFVDTVTVDTGGAVVVAVVVATQTAK